MQLIVLIIPKRESVSLVTTKTIAPIVTLELDLVLEDILIIAAHVETRLNIFQIMPKSILRQWDIFWCSKKKLIWVNLPWRQTKTLDPVRFFEDKQKKISDHYTLN